MEANRAPEEGAAPARAPISALLRWLLLYPVVAAAACFAIGALEVTAAQVLAVILTLVAGGLVGWEASREGCDERRVGGWGALAATLTLILCMVAAGAAYETIYCSDRDCRPVLD